jgi:hypothetical protein
VVARQHDVRRTIAPAFVSSRLPRIGVWHLSCTALVMCSLLRRLVLVTAIAGVTLASSSARAASSERPYDGGEVPSGFKIDHHFATSQWVPLVGGLAVFAGGYLLMMPFWFPDYHDGAYDAPRLAVPVLGPLGEGAKLWGRIGDSGFLAADSLAFTVGFVFLLDGLMQGAGLVTAVVGGVRMASGPRAFLVPDTSKQPMARMRIVPRVDAHSLGVGVSIMNW